MMNDNQIDDSERFRAAVHVIARSQNQTVAGAIYAGATAAAMCRSELTDRTAAAHLMDELESDRLTHAAGLHAGPAAMIRLNLWVSEVWAGISEYAADVVPPTPLTESEKFVHRATVELLLDANPSERTSVVAYAGALAVSIIRCDGAPARSPKGREVAEWLATDPIAAMACKELGDATDSIAMSVGFEWREIQARASVIATMAAIEAA